MSIKITYKTNISKQRIIEVSLHMYLIFLDNVCDKKGKQPEARTMFIQ